MMLQKNKEKARVTVGIRRRDGRNRADQSRPKTPSAKHQENTVESGSNTSSNGTHNDFTDKNVREYDPSVVYTPKSNELPPKA